MGSGGECVFVFLEWLGAARLLRGRGGGGGAGVVEGGGGGGWGGVGGCDCLGSGSPLQHPEFSFKQNAGPYDYPAVSSPQIPGRDLHFRFLNTVKQRSRNSYPGIRPSNYRVKTTKP